MFRAQGVHNSPAMGVVVAASSTNTSREARVAKGRVVVGHRCGRDVGRVDGALRYLLLREGSVTRCPLPDYEGPLHGAVVSVAEERGDEARPRLSSEAPWKR